MIRCLDALLALDYPNYDILVCDNESCDGAARACTERAAGASVPVRVVEVEGTVGRVRNRGAALAAGELIAYTDSDCVPGRRWLTAAVAPFADPAVGVVCGPIVPEPGVPIGPWASYLDVPAPTGRFEAANVLFRRDALMQTSGFDEVVGHLWEDTAAGAAMRRRGWEVAWAPEAIVHHDVTHPGLGWHLRRARRLANVAHIMRRYPEVRRDLLWGRVFLRAQSLNTALLVAGVALAPRRRGALALAIPYLVACRQPPTPAGAADFARGLAYDLSVLRGGVEASVRWRRLVL